MTEEGIMKQLKKACILDPLCYEVDCLFEEDLNAIRGLVDLYNKQKEEIKKLKQTIIIDENVITSLEKDLFEGGRNYIVSKDKIREYVNSPEFLDWHLGFTQLDELEYRKNNINKLLEE